MKQKKTCSKGVDILKAGEVQIKSFFSHPAADETEEDLLPKITDILKAEEAVKHNIFGR